MYNPAADSLMDTVRRFNEMTRRARSGEPSVEDYLQTLASDPVAQWFTEVLREKSEDLQKEQARMDRLTAACKRWYTEATPRLSANRGTVAEAELASILRDLSVIE
jgi:hypothetical protein